MKFIHLADLHFGKLLHGLSLAEQGDQRYWCEQCLQAVREERPDAVLIAGDVYDRSQPSAEARALASWFLTELTGLARVMMIAGNHDSGENIEYLSGLLEAQGLYASGSIAPCLKHVTLRDAFGPVTFWLAPYFFPAKVAETLGMDGLRDYTRAAEALIAAQPLDAAERNVLLAHQFVRSGAADPERGGSESAVGGVAPIDAEAFAALDYVALGHIHKPQRVGREGVRYAGAPLCYHFDEAGREAEGNAERPILVVTLGPKGEAPVIRRRETKALHPLRNITGTLSGILGDQADGGQAEYIHVRLTDRTVPAHARERLEARFEERGSRLLLLDRAAQAVRGAAGQASEQVGERPLTELFRDYYDYQLPDAPMSEADERLIREAAALLEQAQGLEDDPKERQKTAQALMRFALGQKEADL